MEIWKLNEVKRSKDNVLYAYENYISNPTHENWSLFWEAYKIFLVDSEYIPYKDISKNSESMYISFKQNKSIFDLLN